MSEDSGPWIVSQIGAREHYAIPRALHRRGCLGLLCTDTWIRPGSVWSCLPGTRRLRDRWHPDLDGVRVFAPNSRILAFEAMQRIRRRQGWETILARNTLYQRLVIRHLSTHFPTHGTRNEEPGTRHRGGGGAGGGGGGGGGGGLRGGGGGGGSATVRRCEGAKVVRW
jgi:uncharacterized membrane protein YgcG